MSRADFSTIIPAFAPQANDIALNRLFSPQRHYDQPCDVLKDETLDLDERRAILSSWASDACAVESMPALRRPPSAAAPVSFDAIMDALRQLDAMKPSPAEGEQGDMREALHELSA